MSRLARIQIPGVPVHAVIRGNDRRAIFGSEGDRAYFHRMLVDVTRKYGLAVHAYVLMTNHVHLLATPTETGALCRSIQTLGRRYVPYFNHRYGRTGTLWEGRYRSAPIADDCHLIACYRYIEQNPVRAGMERRPGDFRWSSHRANIGLAADDLITPHRVFLEIASSQAERRQAYIELCALALPAATVHEIRDCLNNGWAFGNAEWRQALESEAGRRAVRIGGIRSPRMKRGSASHQHSDPSQGEHSDPSDQEGQGTARILAPV